MNPLTREPISMPLRVQQRILNENIDSKVATYLEKEDLYAEYVRDTFGQDVDDTDAVLPYAREHDLIVLTSDVTDLAEFPSEVHASGSLLYDDTMQAYRVASALISVVDVPESDRISGS